MREGERVEFDTEVSDDGRAKAINVSGPGGAAPQVDSLNLKLKKLFKKIRY